MSAFSYALHATQSTVQMLQQREVKPMTACPFRNNFLPVPFSHFLFVVGLRVDHLTVCIYIRRCLSSHRKKNKFYVWTSGVSRIECPAVRLFTSLDGRHRYHSHRTDHFIIYFVFFLHWVFETVYGLPCRRKGSNETGILVCKTIRWTGVERRR